MNAYRETEGSSTHSSPKYQMKAHGQLYTLGVSPMENTRAYQIRRWVGIRDSLHTFEKEKSFDTAQNQTLIPWLFTM
jgi:hypothetical protein